MNKQFSALLTAVFLMLPVSALSQDDLMKMLNENAESVTNYTTATFKSTHVVNGQSIERMQEKQLDFRISHRFGRINTGGYELWGLDQANIHFSLEYGLTDWLMLGAGRGTYEKTYDGFTKLSILRQSSGAVNMPVSLSVFSSVALNSLKFPDPERNDDLASRLSYSYQILLGRKFGPRFSAQISPTLVHRNLVLTELDPNDTYALGLGGRLKLSSRVSLNAEYYHVVNPENNPGSPVYNPLAVGFDIETGGHVFQLMMTNSLAMIEKGFITETTGQWGKGDIHFGFNISRVFNLKKPQLKVE